MNSPTHTHIHLSLRTECNILYKLNFVCVLVFCSCMCHMCLCVWRPEDNLGVSTRCCQLFCETESLTGWRSARRLGWLASEHRGSFCLHFPRAGFASTSCQAWLSPRVELGYSFLHGKYFPNSTTSPSPYIY